MRFARLTLPIGRSLRQAAPLVTFSTLLYAADRRKYISFMEMPGTETLLRGKYENKIRRHSSVEKIFEVFATQRISNKIMAMDLEDLLRAIVPFNYSTKDPE